MPSVFFKLKKKNFNKPLYFTIIMILKYRNK